jgi:hypothetical protein
VGQGSNDAPTVSEFAGMMKALVPAIGRGFRNAVISYRTESNVFERYARGKTNSLDLSGNEWSDFPPALKGKLGRVMRGLSFRLLSSADDFFKTIAGHVEVGVIATRIARGEGLSGAAFDSRVKSLTDNYGSIAWERAADYAKRLTFQSVLGTRQQEANDKTQGRSDPRLRKRSVDALDVAAEFLIRTKSEKGIKVLDFVVPFVMTPTNIFKMGLEYSPIGTFLAVVDMVREAQDFSKNKKLHGRAAAERLAGQIYNRATLVHDLAAQLMAWGAFFWIKGLLGDEDDESGLPHITGSAPWQGSQSGQRDLQYRTVPPQSIRIGGKWYSYARLEPFATALTLMVDGVKASKDGNLGSYLSLAAGQFKDKTFLAGIGDLINMMEDPDRYGNQWIARIGTGFVPNLIQQTVKAADPHIRETKPTVEGFFPELAMRMKYNLVPQFAPPRIDVWGRPTFKNNGDQHDQPATDLPLQHEVPGRRLGTIAHGRQARGDD